MSRLAAAEQVKRPTISRIVDGLEAAGLARREPSSADGRSVRVDATAKGRRVLQRARKRRIERLAAELAALSADELAVVEQAAALIERGSAHAFTATDRNLREGGGV